MLTQFSSSYPLLRHVDVLFLPLPPACGSHVVPAFFSMGAFRIAALAHGIPIDASLKFGTTSARLFND